MMCFCLIILLAMDCYDLPEHYLQEGVLVKQTFDVF